METRGFPPETPSAAELCYFETRATGTSWSATYPQNVYGVSQFTISR